MNPAASALPMTVAAAAFCAVQVTPFNAAAYSNARPYDAPIATNTRATSPALPPGYLEHHDSGLSFAYHPTAHERVRAAIPVLLRARARMSTQLGRDVLGAIEIRIAAIPDEMRTLGPIEDIPPYAPAIAFSKHKLIVASLGSPRSLEQTDLGTALSHALAHVALDEALDGRFAPLWLHEGYAAHVAGDGTSARAQLMVMATLQRQVYGIAEIGPRFPADAPESSLAFAQAADLTRFLSDKPRRASFVAMLEKTRDGEEFDRALEAAYGSSLASIEGAWHRDMARRYAFLPVFLAGIAIWVLCAAIVFLRRYLERRKARADKPPRDAEAERISAIEMAVARAERMPVRGRGESMGSAIPLEAEVPKVEHEGDWHTLH
ncbi:MAG: hypothetical protein IPM54_33975 [Polyangiaceae bacterium]|nr:hypothetical protein [Polyangiaceae bacterium]